MKRLILLQTQFHFKETNHQKRYTSTLMSEIFASRNFRESLHSQNFFHFAGIYFRESVKLKYFREFIKNVVLIE